MYKRGGRKEVKEGRVRQRRIEEEEKEEKREEKALKTWRYLSVCVDGSGGKEGS